MKTKIKQSMSILLSWIMIISGFTAVPVTVNAAEGKINIGFTSDVHAKTNYLNTWLNTVTDVYGTLDSMVYCGDYGDHSIKKMEDYIVPFLSEIVPKNNSLKDDGKINHVVYTTGNHEYNDNIDQIPGVLSDVITSQNIDGFCRIGQAVPKPGEDNPGYMVYCFGAVGYFKKSAGGGFVDEDIAALDAFLANASKDVPIFIVSHYPLHYYTNGQKSREMYNGEAVIDTLNHYATDHHIVFVWGHNHSIQDPLYGKVLGKGGCYNMIQYTAEASKEINFTYAAAGGMRNDANSNETNFSGLVTTIDQTDKNMTFRYYCRSTKDKVGYPVTVSYGGKGVENNGAVYELCTDSVVDGDYLIVNTNAQGDACAAQKGANNTIAGKQVRVDSRKRISLGTEDVAKLTWTVSARTGDTYYLYNQGDFLNCSNNSIKYTSSGFTYRAWNYSTSTSLLSYKDVTNQYITFSGNNSFGLSTIPGGVYLYKRLEGVSPSPESETQPVTEPSSEPVKTGVRYELISSNADFVPNTKYLIVSTNASGFGAEVLTRNGSSVGEKTVSVNPADKYSSVVFVKGDDIDDSCVWNATAVSNGNMLQNGTAFLELSTADSIIHLTSQATADCYWNISNSNHFRCYPDGKNKRYIVYNNSFQVAGSSGNSVVHLYKEVTYDAYNICTSVVGNGKVTGSETGILAGSKRTVSYMPDEGYRVSSLTVNGNAVAFVPEGGDYTIGSVDKDYTIEVTFVPVVKHTITAVAGKGGSISPSGEVQVFEGEDQTFVVTPEDGYRVDTVEVDGQQTVLDVSNKYTFADVYADHTINVTFEKKPSGDSYYVLVNELKDGKDYIVASVNSLTAGTDDNENRHAVSASTFKDDSGHQLPRPVFVDVAEGDINGKSETYISKVYAFKDHDADAAPYEPGEEAAFDTAVWTAKANGSGFVLTNGKGYLRQSTLSNNMLEYVEDMPGSSNYWHYDSTNNYLQYTTGSSDYAVYLSHGASSSTPTRFKNEFRMNTASSSRRMYLYEKISVVPEAYMVLFRNDDGTTLRNTKVNSGESPTYNGEIPAKLATAQYTYTFSGWTDGTNIYGKDDSLPAVNNNVVYTAVYDVTVNKYTIKFENYNGAELQRSEVEYGAKPEYFGEIPVKPEDDNFTYEFKGWDPAISSVTGDATYTATYKNVSKNLFAGHSISLNGDIGVNFFIAPEAINGTSIADAETAVVKFDWADGQSEVDLKTITPNANTGWYKAVCNVPAAHMAHSIHAVLYINGVAEFETNDYCVQKYAETIISGDYSDELKTLMKEMLNYGAMAQIVFEEELTEHPDLANKNIVNAGYVMDPVTSDMITDAIARANDGATADDMDEVAELLHAKYVTTSVILLAKSTIRHWFAKIDSANTHDYDGVKQNYYYYKEKRDISASELDTLQIFTVGDVSFRYSVLDYALAVINNSTNTDAINLVKAMYWYNQAANVYFG